VNERDRIRMTDEEIRAFLAGPHKLQVATINRDGTPHLVTMYYAPVDDRIAFWTYRSAQKAVNLRRDPRLTCLVEAGDGYDQLRGVQVTGRAELVEEPRRVLEIGTAIYARYLGELDGPVADYVARMATKRVVVIVHPERVVSWDHRKLASRTA
jgi:PPOX class probable F420-dependent enzyme